MSDIVKLNIKSKKFRAIVSDDIVGSENFIEFPELMEREKQEQNHKLELEREFNRGYLEGENAAKKELEKIHSEELLDQSRSFYDMVLTFEERIKIFERDFHKLVISVSKKISEKIIDRQLKIESQIEKLLEENLRKVIGANDIIVKLNPKDYKYIEKSSKRYLNAGGVSKMRFESNENIQIGGCLVESEIGSLDARVESRIEELIKSLENRFVNINSE